MKLKCECGWEGAFSLANPIIGAGWYHITFICPDCGIEALVRGRRRKLEYILTKPGPSEHKVDGPSEGPSV